MAELSVPDGREPGIQLLAVMTVGNGLRPLKRNLSINDVLSQYAYINEALELQLYTSRSDGSRDFVSDRGFRRPCKTAVSALHCNCSRNNFSFTSSPVTWLRPMNQTMPSASAFRAMKTLIWLTAGQPCANHRWHGTVTRNRHSARPYLDLRGQRINSITVLL